MAASLFASLILASSITIGNAQSLGQAAYLAEVCAPTNSSGHPDLNAPCNAVAAIQAQCIYGPSYLPILESGHASGPNDASNQSYTTQAAVASRKRAVPQSPGDEINSDADRPEVQSNETQRVCLCQSQFWDQAVGCFACYKAHGGEMTYAGTMGEGTIQRVSRAYCAVDATPSIGLTDVLFNMVSSIRPSMTASPTGSARHSISFADSIGNKTDVSYYYTPSVTGSAAWVVSQPTGTDGSASYTSTHIEDGQIVATATETDRRTQSSGSGVASGPRATETGNGAAKDGALAVAGVFGLFGLVALL